MFDEIDEIDGDVNSAKDKAGAFCMIVEYALGLPICNFIKEIAHKILGAYQVAIEAWEIFNTNKEKMGQFRGYDKYCHAKANCEAMERC